MNTEEEYDGITEFGMDSDEQFYIQLDETKTVVIRDKEETTVEVYDSGAKIEEGNANNIEEIVKKHKK